MRYQAHDGSASWWVNHKQTFQQEVAGDYIWSPITRRDGGRNEFYDNMQRVREGDIVFSFADGLVKAVGVCVAPAILAPKPAEFGNAGEVWLDEGWRVGVEFVRLDPPVRPKDHMDIIAPTLPEKYSPIRPNGNGNQGAYLAGIPTEMAAVLRRLIGRQWHASGIDRRADGLREDGGTELAGQQVEDVVQMRTDIGVLEKIQLVKARRGQGVYRRNLEQVENQCRVTGATDPRHLRASHIKPWRVSNDREKIDGHNGLLLSPHVDHLFDAGYLSFEDNGRMLISPRMNAETLERWHIDPRNAYPAFRAEQIPYLQYHRDYVFLRD